MGRISLPLALLGMQAMLGAVVDARSNIHFTLLGVQAMLGMVAEAQYNVYYGYTAQELQEFIADTVIDCFFSFSIFLFCTFQFFFHHRRQEWLWKNWFTMGQTATAGKSAKKEKM